MKNILQFLLFGSVGIAAQLDSAYRQNVELHNEKGEIIELALRGHDESMSSSNPGVFCGLIDFSTELDSALKQHLEEALVFKDSGDVSSECNFTTTTDSEDSLGRIRLNEDVVGIEDIINNTKERFEKIYVTDSEHIHIGPVTYINGPVHIETNSITLNQKAVEDRPSEENRFANIMRTSFTIIPRRAWVAEPPIEPPVELEEPAKFVIICHTATEEARTISENSYLIRLIQSFHVKGRGWNDIAYNFLIGGDGKAYEGRGWNIVGSHTYKFNNKSIGIAFIGCYLDNLPPPSAIRTAQELIEMGVKIGVIDPNYSLLAHCQVSCTKSPGDALYKEITTWKNWEPSFQYFSDSV